VGEEEQSKEDLFYTSLRFSLPQPYLNIDGGGGCSPVGEDRIKKTCPTSLFDSLGLNPT